MRVFLFFAVKKRYYFSIYYIFSKLSMKHNFESTIVKKELHENFGPIVVWFGRGVLWQFNDFENDK